MHLLSPWEFQWCGIQSPSECHFTGGRNRQELDYPWRWSGPSRSLDTSPPYLFCNNTRILETIPFLKYLSLYSNVVANLIVLKGSIFSKTLNCENTQIFNITKIVSSSTPDLTQPSGGNESFLSKYWRSYYHSTSQSNKRFRLHIDEENCIILFREFGNMKPADLLGKRF